jgi:hypothetical protein
MPRKKLYGIFYRNAEGKLVGYTEKSLSMIWAKNAVRVWTLKEALQMLKELRPRHRKYCFILRVSRANKEIKIHWHKWRPVWQKRTDEKIAWWHHCNVFFEEK